MAYDYQVRVCDRCDEPFKDESFGKIFPPRSWRDGSSIGGRVIAESRILGGDVTKDKVYCSTCSDYMQRAVERAKQLAERDFERRRDNVRICDKCGGEGTIHEITCPRCEGRKVIFISLFNEFFADSSPKNFELYKEYLPNDFFKK